MITCFEQLLNMRTSKPILLYADSNAITSGVDPGDSLSTLFTIIAKPSLGFFIG